MSVSGARQERAWSAPETRQERAGSAPGTRQGRAWRAPGAGQAQFVPFFRLRRGQKARKLRCVLYFWRVFASGAENASFSSSF